MSRGRSSFEQRNSYQQNYNSKKVSAVTKPSGNVDEELNKVEGDFKLILSHEVMGLGDLSSLHSSEGALNTNRSSKSDDDKTITTENSNDEEANQKNYLNKAKRFVRKQAKAFMRNFIDYGPSYNDEPFNSALIDQCARPVPRYFEIHSLLNSRVDPNLPDPEDLYYTPMHWAARNAHYLVMRMLRRAGAAINVTNEMGLTPLDLCVMMKQPPNKRKDQLKIAKYFLENGALVNTRDKGGYGPIDYAAMNQDLELITLLLEYGAVIRRENSNLKVPRDNIFNYVHDPECYKALYEKLKVEKQEYARKKEIDDKIKALANEETFYIENKKSLSKKKMKKIERQKKFDDTKKLEELERVRKKKLKDDMENNLQEQAEMKAAQTGAWVKNELDGNWEPVEKLPNVNRLDELYRVSKKLIDDLHTENRVDSYNNKWKRFTNGGEIELPWKKEEPFFLPDIHQKKSESVSSNKRKVLMKGAGNKLVDLDYKDENDLALEGESLDDVFNDLSSV